jgi:hypothetical protein
MNVGPIQHLPVTTDVYDSSRQVRAPQPPHSSSENEPVKAASKPQVSVPGPPLVHDEVNLRWDSSDQLRIYQFVNPQSGALVLQVPSEQVLNVIHGIQKWLQEASVPEEAPQKKK